MFKRFSSTLSPFVFFRLDTDRLVLLSMALMMPLIQMMHPLPQRISLLQQVLAYAVISCSLLVFCCSLFSFMSRRYVYVAILFLGSLLGIYLLMSLHSLKFAPTFKTAYLLLILLFPWYLENKRNLILFLGLNTLGALYTLVTTAGPGEQAYHFLIGLLLANSFMYVLVGDHIEQQRELSRKGVYYRRIIEKLNDGVLQMDAKGTITMANQSFCQIIGYRRRDIIGQMHISALISKENRKILARHLKDRKKGRSGKYEIRFVRKNGEAIWLSMSIRPQFDAAGKLLGSTSIVSDITRQKAATEARNRYARSLARTHKALEATHLELGRFAQIASTDLKAPLYGMIADVEILKSHFANQTYDLAQPVLEVLSQGAKRLDALMHALWQYASLSGQALQYERIATSTLIEDLARDLLAYRRPLLVGELPDIYADPRQIRQLFYHLLHNALKFSPDDTPLHIYAHIRPGKNKVVFCLADQGPGIPEELLEHVFLIFQKGLQQEQQGVGLGLAICKKIVLNHQGKIWIESAEGQGCKVYVQLPLSPPEQA